MDVILCTHWHDDHLCPEALPRLATTFPKCKIVVPSRSLEICRTWGIPDAQLIGTNGHRMQSIDPLRFKAIPAAHTELDFDEDGASWYVGYVLECDGICIYHMGDGQPWPGWYTAIKKAAESFKGEDKETSE